MFFLSLTGRWAAPGHFKRTAASHPVGMAIEVLIHWSDVGQSEDIQRVIGSGMRFVFFVHSARITQCRSGCPLLYSLHLSWRLTWWAFYTPFDNLQNTNTKLFSNHGAISLLSDSYQVIWGKSQKFLKINQMVSKIRFLAWCNMSFMGIAIAIETKFMMKTSTLNSAVQGKHPCLLQGCDSDEYCSSARGMIWIRPCLIQCTLDGGHSFHHQSISLTVLTRSTKTANVAHAAWSVAEIQYTLTIVSTVKITFGAWTAFRRNEKIQSVWRRKPK